MRVIPFSRYFPKGHPKAGDATFFMEKTLCGLGITMETLPRHLTGIINDFQMLCEPDDHKYHTIRAGNRWKPGDQFSARVWSGLPYKSKQIEFAQLEVKKTWDFSIRELDQRYEGVFLNDSLIGVFDKYNIILQQIARNDGLSADDFISWFSMHPKKEGKEFHSQIICWNENINY